MSEGAGPSEIAPEATAWTDACLIAALFAVDPVGLGGVALLAAPGPVRDAWLARFRDLLPEEVPLRPLPVNISDERLLGGLDLAVALKRRERLFRRGILAEADGGVLVATMAERQEPATLARIAQAMDRGLVLTERDGISAVEQSRFGLIAIDESLDDEPGLPTVLLDRLAFRLALEGIGHSDIAGPIANTKTTKRAQQCLAKVGISDAALGTLCEASAVFGIASLRAPLLATRAARAHAALSGRLSVADEDVLVAARLVLAPRAVAVPEASSDPQPEDEEQRDTGDDDAQSSESLDPNNLRDLLIESVRSRLPADLLTDLEGQKARAVPRARHAGSGSVRRSQVRGRPIGARRGALHGGARLNLLATLRAAAPLQGMRRTYPMRRDNEGISVLPSDFRITRFKQRSEHVALFVVDASGSSALNRMAEAKGAVELLLAKSYARRDQVSLIAFRGQTAELILPPTRSLLRAKRSLAGLAGGGGTPLASALDQARILALDLRRRGLTVTLVILTDGQANIARDHSPGRPKARADAQAAAQALAIEGFAALLIDTSPRPRPEAQSLATAMDARYLALPRADAVSMSEVVYESMESM